MSERTEGDEMPSGTTGPADAPKEDTQKMSDCNGNTGPKSSGDGTPIAARNLIATLLNRLVLASIAKGAQTQIDVPDEDRITDEDLDGYEGKILGLVDEILTGAGPADAGSHETTIAESGSQGDSARFGNNRTASCLRANP
jgi:hypothetical protein